MRGSKIYFDGSLKDKFLIMYVIFLFSTKYLFISVSSIELYSISILNFVSVSWSLSFFIKMRWYRSEDMKYVSLIVSEDTAHDVIKELGMLDIIQFTDLNHELVPFQRRYVSYIRRCDEIERKLRYMKGEIDKFRIPTEIQGGYEDFIARSTASYESANRSGNNLLEKLDDDLEKYETELKEYTVYLDKLTSEFNEKMEYKEVLLKVQQFFHDEGPNINENTMFGSSSSSDGGFNSLTSESNNQDRFAFSHMAGVVKSEDRGRFERMLFRATRGNMYVRFGEIEAAIKDPMTGEEVKKDVFLIFYKSESIERKIGKICTAFQANIYRIPNSEDMNAFVQATQECSRDLSTAKEIMKRNSQKKEQLCEKLAKFWEDWMWSVTREKTIYHTMNMFKADVSGMLRGEGWVIARQEVDARKALTKAHGQFESLPSLLEEVPQPWPTPPTYFYLDKYTEAFQEFVDTNGVPRYKEVNPALYTAASFPFLFGIMYGDIGHGLCVMIAGLYLILTEAAIEKRSTTEEMKGLYKGRYMFFLMGLCAMYNGFIYNDYFSLGWNLFGTRYQCDTEHGGECVHNTAYGDPAGVYPFGVDPVWHIVTADLQFINSMKMKTAVIVGVIHMTWGLILRGFNAIYFRDATEMLFEVIPMIIFDLSFFGYMCVLIIIKWSINWDERMLSGTCILDSGPDYTRCNSTTAACHVYGTQTPCTMTTTVEQMCPLDLGGQTGGCQPPNLIGTIMDMALSPGTLNEPMYSGQNQIQLLLVLLAALSVPLILCGKPCVIYFQNRDSHTQLHVDDHDDPYDTEGGHHGHGGHGGHEEEDFSEICIHQIIETIEFVLGMVSNTASYLRLWALSLAHSQLSAVFWSKSFVPGLATGNPVFIFVAFAVFWAVTTGVMLLMDTMECFLHALRLHWIEFQSKFFKGDGNAFVPLSIPRLCKEVTTTY